MNADMNECFIDLSSFDSEAEIRFCLEGDIINITFPKRYEMERHDLFLFLWVINTILKTDFNIVLPNRPILKEDDEIPQATLVCQSLRSIEGLDFDIQITTLGNIYIFNDIDSDIGYFDNDITMSFKTVDFIAFMARFFKQ